MDGWRLIVQIMDNLKDIQNMTSKLLFFDLETTGVKFWRNGIHQIGGIVDIDGQEAERLATSPDGRDVVVPGKWHGKFPKKKATEEQLKKVEYKSLIR